MGKIGNWKGRQVVDDTRIPVLRINDSTSSLTVLVYERKTGLLSSGIRGFTKGINDTMPGTSR